jgi:hypothetical protein
MLPHRASYWKTTVLAGSFTILYLSLAGAHFPQSFGVVSWAVRLLLGLAALGSFMAMIGGMLCLYRDRRDAAGRPDIFFERVNRPTESRRQGLRFVRNIFALVFEIRPQVGDIVEVRSATEILHTLDSDGTLDGLPFMPEMLAFCGLHFRVQHRVDKINDMKTKIGLRRFRRTVTLENVRCHGSAHDGCQAECQILWKDNWLHRLKPTVGLDVNQLTPNVEAGAIRGNSYIGHGLLKTTNKVSESDGTVYFCQMTELFRASEPMSSWDIRQDLRPLLHGNITLPVFLVGLLTRIFNYVQRVRGGTPYPFRPNGETRHTPREDLGLRPGDIVRVRSRDAIAKTLNANSRNRGLWFDREMLKLCDKRFVVRRRVEKLIAENTGRMVTMETPCITLEGGTATGEFLRFCPQNEFIFWRECWLQRDDSAAEMNGLNVMSCSIDKRLHGTSALSPNIKPAV